MAFGWQNFKLTRKNGYVWILSILQNPGHQRTLVSFTLTYIMEHFLSVHIQIVIYLLM